MPLEILVLMGKTRDINAEIRDQKLANAEIRGQKSVDTEAKSHKCLKFKLRDPKWTRLGSELEDK